MTPGIDAQVTPYGDVWFVVGLQGERIPMYSDATAEGAAIAAYLAGDWSSLYADEIEFFRVAL